MRENIIDPAFNSDTSSHHSSSCGNPEFVRNEQDKEARSSFSLVCAFRCAAAGIAYTFKTQRNMKIHVAVAVLAFLLGFFLSFDLYSWVALVLCSVLVFAAECLNTAVESVVDLLCPTYHVLARRAKDCAAAAVLVCSVGALLVACFIYPHALWTLLAK